MQRSETLIEAPAEMKQQSLHPFIRALPVAAIIVVLSALVFVVSNWLYGVLVAYFYNYISNDDNRIIAFPLVNFAYLVSCAALFPTLWFIKKFSQWWQVFVKSGKHSFIVRLLCLIFGFIIVAGLVNSITPLQSIRTSINIVRYLGPHGFDLVNDGRSLIFLTELGGIEGTKIIYFPVLALFGLLLVALYKRLRTHPTAVFQNPTARFIVVQASSLLAIITFLQVVSLVLSTIALIILSVGDHHHIFQVLRQYGVLTPTDYRFSSPLAGPYTIDVTLRYLFIPIIFSIILSLYIYFRVFRLNISAVQAGIFHFIANLWLTAVSLPLIFGGDQNSLIYLPFIASALSLTTIGVFSGKIAVFIISTFVLPSIRSAITSMLGNKAKEVLIPPKKDQKATQAES